MNRLLVVLLAATTLLVGADPKSVKTNRYDGRTRITDKSGRTVGEVDRNRYDGKIRIRRTR